MNILYPEIERLLNILEAARLKNVKRVILIGCISSVIGGKFREEYNETIWATPDECDIIERTRFFVEKTAWYYVKKYEKDFNFTVLLPSLMIGPINKIDDDTEAVNFINALAKNPSQKLMELMFGLVDVRDVASITVNIINNEKTFGERYIVNEGTYWLKEIFNIIHEGTEHQETVNIGFFKGFILKFLSWFDESTKKILEFNKKKFIIDTEKIKGDVKTNYRNINISINETLKSLVEYDKLPSTFLKL